MTSTPGKKITFIDKEEPKGTNEAHVQKKLGLAAEDLTSSVQLMRLEWKNWFLFTVTDEAAAALAKKGLPPEVLTIAEPPMGFAKKPHAYTP